MATRNVCVDHDPRRAVTYERKRRREMTVSEVIEVVKALQPTARSQTFPFRVGDSVFIRTVTLYYTGKITGISGQWITLSEAAWIADTGRFHQFLTEGKCNEYEGIPETVSIPMGSIIDVIPWRHALLKGQK
jgi:O-acetylhomoserine/O-acetylserine sulfhydrylase-like pyridoxal-dependent enzyme